MAQRRPSTLRLALDILALTLVSIFFLSMLGGLVVADGRATRLYLAGLTAVGLLLVTRGLLNLRRTLNEHVDDAEESSTGST